jgi:hypothetical protein
MQQLASKETNGAEKRRHLRVPIAAAAVVHKDNACLGRFWMVNLSVSGALIAGDMGLRLGEKVRLRIELGALESVLVHARVVRVGETSPSPTVGFAFDHDSDQDDGAPVRRSIADAVAGALRNDPRQVLIVEKSHTSRRELKFQIRCLGWSCVVVSTPLEAITALNESHQFACVLVGLTGDPAVAADLLQYLAEAHPRLPRVRVAELEGARRADAATDPNTPRPWFSSALARALGI